MEILTNNEKNIVQLKFPVYGIAFQKTKIETRLIIYARLGTFISALVVSGSKVYLYDGDTIERSTCRQCFIVRKDGILKSKFISKN